MPAPKVAFLMFDYQSRRSKNSTSKSDSVAFTFDTQIFQGNDLHQCTFTDTRPEPPQFDQKTLFAAAAANLYLLLGLKRQSSIVNESTLILVIDFYFY